MFNTLLVALDGGPQHARVLDLAAAIAGPHSRLHLLCVLDPEFALAADASEADRIEYPEAARQRSRAEAVLAEAPGRAARTRRRRHRADALRRPGRSDQRAGPAPEVRPDRHRPPPPVPAGTPVRTLDRAMDHRPRALSGAGGNPRPTALATMASRSPLFPARVNYRAFGRQFGRGEQALLGAIRQLRDPDLQANGLAQLSGLGLGQKGCDAFIGLLPLLATPPLRSICCRPALLHCRQRAGPAGLPAAHRTMAACPAPRRRHAGTVAPAAGALCDGRAGGKPAVAAALAVTGRAEAARSDRLAAAAISRRAPV